MSRTETTEQPWTEEEARSFWEKVGGLREELPQQQRDAFDAILAGAAQAAQDVAGEDPGDEEAAGFRQTLAAFRDSLPPQQRDAFNSVMAAGATQLRASGDDVQAFMDPVTIMVGAAIGSWAIIGVEEAAKAGAFKAVDWQKAAEGWKQKQKPPA